jgi:hypothetical protein
VIAISDKNLMWLGWIYKNRNSLSRKINLKIWECPPHTFERLRERVIKDYWMGEYQNPPYTFNR